jgi:hypothetical protein
MGSEERPENFLPRGEGGARQSEDKASRGTTGWSGEATPPKRRSNHDARAERDTIIIATGRGGREQKHAKEERRM